jgi:hypothetical protein
VHDATTGDQHREPWTRRQDICKDRRGRQQVLEVVEDEQHVPIAKVFDEQVFGVPFALLECADNARKGVGQERRGGE